MEPDGTRTTEEIRERPEMPGKKAPEPEIERREGEPGEAARERPEMPAPKPEEPEGPGRKEPEPERPGGRERSAGSARG